MGFLLCDARGVFPPVPSKFPRCLVLRYDDRTTASRSTWLQEMLHVYASCRSGHLVLLIKICSKVLWPPLCWNSACVPSARAFQYRRLGPISYMSISSAQIIAWLPWLNLSPKPYDLSDIVEACAVWQLASHAIKSEGLRVRCIISQLLLSKFV